eukprot:6197799-Pleurochrysis_carterae.AAC.2
MQVRSMKRVRMSVNKSAYLPNCAKSLIRHCCNVWWPTTAQSQLSRLKRPQPIASDMDGRRAERSARETLAWFASGGSQLRSHSFASDQGRVAARDVAERPRRDRTLVAFLRVRDTQLSCPALFGSRTDYEIAFLPVLLPAGCSAQADT